VIAGEWWNASIIDVDGDGDAFGTELEPCEELRSSVSISDLKGHVVCPMPRRATCGSR
jgi:hypothetical protein